MDGYLIKEFSAGLIVLRGMNHPLFGILLGAGAILFLFYILYKLKIFRLVHELAYIFLSFGILFSSSAFFFLFRSTPKWITFNAEEEACVFERGLKDYRIPYSQFESFRVHRDLRGLDKSLEYQRADYLLSLEDIHGFQFILTVSPDQEELQNMAKRLTIALDIDLYFEDELFYEGNGRYSSDEPFSMELESGKFKRFLEKGELLYRFPARRNIWIILFFLLNLFGLNLLIVKVFLPSKEKRSIQASGTVFGVGIIVILQILLILMFSFTLFGYHEWSFSPDRVCFSRKIFGHNLETYCLSPELLGGAQVDLLNQEKEIRLFTEDGLEIFYDTLYTFEMKNHPSLFAFEKQIAKMNAETITIEADSLNLKEIFFLEREMLAHISNGEE